jgi:transposase
MDLIVMGKRETRRLGTVEAAVQGRISSRQGAQALGLSIRQFKRLRRRFVMEGAAGLVHRNRGRRSSRRLREMTRERVIELLTGAVKLNDHHLADLVAREGRAVSAATVRRWRQELHLPPKRQRRPPRHRRRRDRAPQRGALVLIDGSPFAWFDEAQEPCTLLGAIDDATSEVLALTFRPTEDLHGYVTLLQGVITSHGAPLALYGDRSAILIRSDPYWSLEEELAGRQSPTQFGAMLEELGIGFIAARSPQAKGRVERLWATLQDRLASELRLGGHHTIDAAEAYLPSFITAHNHRYGRSPQDSTSAFRTAPQPLPRVLACRYPRVVARDNTITIPGRWAQIPPGPGGRSWHRAHVEVREQLDGRLVVLHPRHGVIAEQPPPPGTFTLESRHCERSHSQRRIAGYAHQPEILRPAPRPRRQQSLGNLTNIRRPATGHPWKGRNPQPPTPPVGVGG